MSRLSVKKEQEQLSCTNCGMKLTDDKHILCSTCRYRLMNKFHLTEDEQ